MNSVPIVPRIEDLPYSSSPPIEFSFRSTITVNAGVYTWPGIPAALTPNRPIMSSSLYYFRAINLSADIDSYDYSANIGTIPTFQTYLKSRSKNPLFREPIYMTQFLTNFDYRFVWITHQDNDTLLSSFSGTINQGPALVGKISITLTAIISAQEIVDDAFIKRFKDHSFPKGE